MKNREYKKLYTTVREHFDSSDPWHSAMSLWFDVAFELHAQGADIPARWEYRPGAQNERDPDSLFAAEIEGADEKALVRLGNVLERYTRMIRDEYY